MIEIHFTTQTPRVVAYSLSQFGRQPMGVFLDELLDCVQDAKRRIEANEDLGSGVKSADVSSAPSSSNSMVRDKGVGGGVS